MEQLLELLEDMHPDIDFSLETALVDDGILESFDLITIIAEISDLFGVVIHGQEINAENFNSLEAIWELVERKMGR